MRATLRQWWPALKALLGLAIVYYVGARFWRDLSQPGLAERVYRARLKAAEAAEAAGWHLGNEVTLLWDDPRLPLPDLDPLISPAPPAGP